MGCGIFKTPWNICSAFKHFHSLSLNSAVYSSLGFTMWRQCLLPHVALISIDAINSAWIKSLLFSPALGWSGLRGWMSPKAINHGQWGVSLHTALKAFWKLPSSMLSSPKTMSTGKKGMALTLWLQPVPVLLPAPHAAPARHRASTSAES